MDNLPIESAESTRLAKAAMTRRFYTRSVVKGEITLPAVPSMIDEYVTMCAGLFAGVGRKFSDEELAHLRAVLQGQLAEAYAASQRSTIVISYNAPMGPTLHYQVRAQWRTVAQEYENWIATREPPLFGTEPDARVWALANEAADPTTHRVLEIGAGTGRNALALARRGHPVDVVEMTPKFADIIRSDAERDSLDVRVIMRDVFSTMDDLRQDYQLMVLSEVVPAGRRSSCAICSNSLPSALLPVPAWCSTPSWRTEITHPTKPRVSSGSRCIPGCARGPRCLLQRPAFLSNSSPTTRYTTTRKRTCHRAPGRPPVGTPTGSVASTCSPPTLRAARSRCAGWCSRGGGEQSQKPPKPVGFGGWYVN